jgi:hypothetical protein
MMIASQVTNVFTASGQSAGRLTVASRVSQLFGDSDPLYVMTIVLRSRR